MSNFVKIELGSPLILELKLDDGDTTKFPRAVVQNGAGVDVAGSPFALTHIGNGRYRSTSFTPGAEGYFTADYLVYGDAGFTQLSGKYRESYDLFKVDDTEINVQGLRDNYTNTRAANLDNLDTTVSSRQSEADALTRFNSLTSDVSDVQARTDLLETEADALTRFNTLASDVSDVQTRVDLLETEADALTRFNNLASEHEDTQTAISNLNDPSAAQIADAVWDESSIDHNAAGSMGEQQNRLDATISSRQSEADSLTRFNDNQTDIAAVQTRVDLLQTESDAETRYNALISEHNDTQIQISNLNDPTVAQIADAVWDEDSADHNTAGSMGEQQNRLDTTVSSRQSEADALSRFNDNQTDIAAVQSRADLLQTESDALSRFNILSSEHDDTQNAINALNDPSASQIADAVWDEASADHNTVGTMGEQQNRLDATISSRSSQASQDIIDNNIDSIKVKTDQITFAGGLVEAVAQTVNDKTGYSLTASEREAISTEVQSGILDEGDGQKILEAIVNAIGNENVDEIALVAAIRSDLERNGGTLDTIDSNVSNIKSTVDTNLDTEVSSRQSEADALARFNTLQSEHDDTQTAISNLNDPTASQIADSVWDESSVDHNTPGSMGEQQNRIDATISSRQSETNALSRFNSTNTNIDANETKIDAINTKLGTPTDTDVSTDIANVQARANLLETEADALSRFNSLASEHEDTQTAISNLNDPTAAQIADAVWDESLVDHNTAGSMGAHQNLIDDIRDDAADLNDNKITAPRASNLDNLDTTVSSRQSETDALSRFNDNQTDIAAVQTRVDLLETESDALTRFNSLASDVSDVQTRVDLLQTETDALTRFNNLITEHDDTQTKIDNLTGSGGAGLTLENIADAVWDEVLQGAPHSIPGSAGNFLETVKVNNQVVFDEITTEPYSLENIFADIQNTKALVTSEANENEAKINQVLTNIGNQTTTLVDEIGENRTQIQTVNSNINNTRNTLITEIDQNENKIDTISSQVNGIQNNTDVVAVVPERMTPPDSGTKEYELFLALFNDSGSPENADSTPTVTIYDNAGTVFRAEANMTAIAGKTGQYEYSLNLTDAQVAKVLRIEFKYVKASETRYAIRSSEIVEFDSTLADIETKVNSIKTTSEDNNLLLSGADGLASIKNRVNTAISEINQNETKIDGIKSVTDSLPNNIATTVDVGDVETKVDNLPSLAQIQSSLTTQTSSIKGIDNRTISEVYNNERGTDNALTANDPRLDFLDVAVSSRSSHGPSDVWSYVNRTLTSATPLTSADAEKVWDILLTNISEPGSIGERIKTFLDVAVSSRSSLSEAQIDNKLSPLAKENTLTGVGSAVANENNENQVLINSALNLLNAIKPQTDKIVSGGATESTVISEANQNQSLIQGLDNLLNLVRAKTDNLPADPAKESTVNNIPTNPLEDTDPRLNSLSNLSRLDVAVSTRAENFPLDYAKQVDIDVAKNELKSEINQNEVLINALPRQPYFDNKFSSFNNISSDLADIKGSGFISSDHGLVAIKTEVENIPGGSGSGGASAQDIWEYPSRELTSFPDFATSQELTQAKDDIKDTLTQYTCQMATTINRAQDEQIVMAWLDLNGQTLPSAEKATVEILQDSNVIWTGSSEIADPNGVFLITRSNISSLITQADLPYSVKVTVEYQDQEYTTVKPFTAVG